MSGAASGELRSTAQPSAMDETRIATRSSCGALTSMPSTAQKSATATAARLRACGLLAGGRTKLREVVLQQPDESAVLREVAALQRLLRLVVVVGRLLHQLGHGLGGCG